MVFPEHQVYRPRPLCEQILQIQLAKEKWNQVFRQAGKQYAESELPDRVTQVSRTYYVALTSCIIEEEIDIEAKGNSVAESDEDKEDMAPWVLDEERYENESTMMSIVKGTRKARFRLNRVGVAAPQKSPSRASKTRFSFAAAEYYSQNSHKESMWHMKWLSRLKRFKLDTDSGDSSDDNGKPADGAMQGSSLQAPDILSNAKNSLAGSLGSGVEIDDIILH